VDTDTGMGDPEPQKQALHGEGPAARSWIIWLKAFRDKNWLRNSTE